MATKLAEVRAAEPDLLSDTAAACEAAGAFLTDAKQSVLRKVSRGGKVDSALIEQEQLAAHGFAWLKVYVEALRAMQGWAERLREEVLAAFEAGAPLSAWLDRHERFVFHFTPTSCSWLNAVEGFFAKLSRRRLKRGVFRSVVDLQAAINRFLAETNAEPKPFTWTADPDKIIAAVRRGHQALDSIHYLI